jgi:signal transduction histidine kinase
LKADDLTRNIPIIFISALDEIHKKVKAFEAGGVDYILKPFQEEEILARVKAHLNLRDMQSQLREQNAQLQDEIRKRKQAETEILAANDELKKTLNHLQRTQDQLIESEKMAALGQMTAGIAHELKNPLGVILGSAQVVANGARPMEMREEAAHFIIDEIERLNKTLESFLSFSKPAPPELSPTDLNQLLEETLVVAGAQMEEKRIRVEKALTSDRGVCLADKDQIRQVFWNILINAQQAMPSGGRLRVSSVGRTVAPCQAGPPEAGIHLGPTREWVVHIEDSGGGMPAAQVKQIFEPFVSFRSDGIGLGLSIVHQILKLHQARIEVESTLNQGTLFSLIFACADHYGDKEI